MTTLQPITLNLKGCYFDEIAEGTKKFEFRLKTPYWATRLDGKIFSEIIIKHGYPKRSDTSKVIRRPWLGYEIQTITHRFFGPHPVTVYAIQVN
jgi:hypothetical protein